MVTATTENLLKISRLTQRELDLMTGIFLQHPDIKRVVLFGSRASHEESNLRHSALSSSLPTADCQLSSLHLPTIFFSHYVY